MAESDRKNELFREAKSNKMNELQKLRSLYRESVQERCGPSDNKFVDFLKEGRAVQKNESISDESDMWMGDSAHW